MNLVGEEFKLKRPQAHGAQLDQVTHSVILILSTATQVSNAKNGFFVRDVILPCDNSEFSPNY
jgi:hypothetical protein